MRRHSTHKNPYPGLRAFDFEDSHLFFGRQSQTRQLLKRLDSSCLLAVIGPSGSGKSSLVRAGMLPHLYGLDTSVWRFTSFCVGHDPIGNLAKAINRPGILWESVEPSGKSSEEGGWYPGLFTEATLRRGPLGLMEVVEQARWDRNYKLLLVVDQFEELFRFRSKNQEDDSAFVKLLLAATRDRRHSIYVILTMRADYLGDCARYRDLPEAVNESQYLIPRMTRDELRQAIECPARMAGSRISPRMVQHLLNRVGDEPDHLPLLQHALMRTWDHWHDLSGREEGEKIGGEGRGEEGLIDFGHYEAIGTMESALDNHAEQALKDAARQLPDPVAVSAEPEVEHDGEKVPRGRWLAEVLFKRLTEPSRSNREGRCPTPLQEIADVAGTEWEEVARVIECFRQRGRAFLMPPPPRPLGPETMIDISHESLMRAWKNLGVWIRQEEESARVYELLIHRTELAARERARGHPPVWLRSPDLDIVDRWYRQNRPNEAWARRYHPNLQETVRFLTRSRSEAVEETRRQRRKRLVAGWVVGFVVAALVFGLLAWEQRNRALHEKDRAQHLLSRDYWSRALDAREAGEGLRAAHFFARSAQQAPNPAEARNADLAVQQYLDGLLLAAHLGHRGKVGGALFAKGGRHLLTWTDAGELKLWEADEGRKIWAAELTAADEPGTLRPPAIGGALFSPDLRRVLSWSRDRSLHLWDAGTGTLLATMNHDDRVWGARLDGQGQRILSWSADGTARLWEATGEPVAVMAHNEGDSVLGALFYAGDRRILTWGDDRTARLWEAAGGRPVGRVMTHPGPVAYAELGPNEELILTRAGEPAARVWSADGEPVAILRHDSSVLGARFSSDGRWIATWGAGPSVRLWRRDGNRGWREGSVLEHEGDGEVRGAAFCRDSLRVLTWSDDGTARLWRSADGSQERVFRHDGPVLGAQQNARDQLLVTWAADGIARLWDVELEKIPLREVRHRGRLRSASMVAPDFALSWSEDGETRLWEVPESPPAPLTARAHGPGVHGWRSVTLDGGGLPARSLWQRGTLGGVAVDDRGLWIVTWGDDRNALLWRRFPGFPNSRRMAHEGVVRGAHLDPESGIVVTWGDDGMKCWPETDTRSATVARQTSIGSDSDSPQGSIAFSDDRRLAVTWNGDGKLSVWKLPACELAVEFHHGRSLSGAVLSRDRQAVLSWDRAGIAKLWSLTDRTLAVPSMKHREEVVGAVFSPDQRRILTWSFDGTAQLWRRSDGGRDSLMMRHHGPIWEARFTPDGRFVLTRGDDGLAQVWDARDGTPIGPPLSHTSMRTARSASVIQELQVDLGRSPRILTRDNRTARLWTLDGKALTPPAGMEAIAEQSITGARLAPDGHTVLTWSDDGTARLWSGDHGGAMGEVMKHEGAVLGAEFVAEGKLILTWSDDGTAHLWGADGAPDGPVVGHHQGPVCEARLSPDGRFLLTRGGDGLVLLWNVGDGSLALPAIQYRSGFSPTCIDQDNWRELGGARFFDDGRALLTWGNNGTTLLVHLDGHSDLSPANLPLAVEVWTATRIDNAGRLTPLSEVEWHDRFEVYRELAPGHFAKLRAALDDSRTGGSRSPDDWGG